MHKIIEIFEYIWYNIPTGIGNLIHWFPIVWRDRDWDFSFLFFLLEFKLKRMEKVVRNGMFVGCEKQADHIKTCYLLLGRLGDDLIYDEMAYKNHNEKWGEAKLSCCANGELNINRPNVKSEKDKEQERKEFNRCWKHSNYMKAQDLEYLLHLIRKHIWNWSD